MDDTTKARGTLEQRCKNTEVPNFQHGRSQTRLNQLKMMFKRKVFFGVVVFACMTLLGLYLSAQSNFSRSAYQLKASVVTDLIQPTRNAPAKSKEVKNATVKKKEMKTATAKTKELKIAEKVTPSQQEKTITDKESVSALNVTCQRGYVQERILRLIPEFDVNAHIFLEPGYKQWKDFESMRASRYPYGLDNTVDVIDNVMEMLPAAGKADRFGNRSEVCRRCILVGSSGASLGKKLGSQIDSYDVVIRMNDAPLEKYETDVGKKTTFRLIYPESAVGKPSRYENDTDIGFLVYKPNDIKWLEAVLEKKNPLKLNLAFWKSVPTVMKTPPGQVRIINPGLHTEAREQFSSDKKRPSCGYVALVMALHYCDHVDITGFGFDINLPVHYFKGTDKGTPRGVHSWSDEKQHILQMLHCGIIERDLTGLYAKEAKLWAPSSFNCTKT
ncbi:CMP-N-acetylneuraminate-beta-1,4-galactoside alpha-2,3-sialyltransferase-like isoform X2 [Ptychodera flava]|uniref:CMP-N-acetylneuraminate-beta-1,4-galactoside alpha-2,3-sialyltransferase-like isoform X2 n=2 Tax=Ptychodera flava TaxID=63121 RepID=UPI00396A6233